MNLRAGYGAGLFVCLAFLAPDVHGSVVQLTNGSVYRDVTILAKSPAQLNLRTQFGDIAVPLSSVATIDGVPPAAKAPTEAAPAPSPLPAAPEGAASSELEYHHDWRMECLLLGCGAAVFAWLATMVWTQKELRENRSGETDWNVVSLLLPFGGFFLFKACGGVSLLKKRKSAPGLAASTPVDPTFVERGAQTAAEDDGATGSEAARRILEEAVQARTSDVHIDPQENGYKVRFRIDGILQERTLLEKTSGLRVVSALKTLGGIDVAEKRKAQDGRFRIQFSTRDVDMRVSTASAIFGEKLVVRILDRKAGIFGLADLGMPEEMVAQFNQAIHSRSGMILATGPTGAGKTSTLYAALSQLDKTRLNVMTIEDPAEYELEGATQIPVNPKAGITYESGLRSILRQDPDVIFVGEMRDAEAAKIAIRAALTGTLVFSSLHTRDAVNCIPRLAEMGVEASQMASALLMVIAQRLVRVLCNACREPYACSGGELDAIGLGLPPGETIYRAKGCPECSQTGYLGRTGIFELFVLDDELRRAVSRQDGEAELLELARAKGFRAYRESGGEKILLGITTVDEVLQAG